MTRKFFCRLTLSLALFGVFMLAATPNLNAQSAPPAPATPSIGLSAAPYPTPGPYTQPTEIIFTLTLSDSTNGATICYNVTNSSGSIVASGCIAAPNFTSTAHGSASVATPINATSGYTATAYAYIPVNPTACPPTPASGNSSTTTVNF